MIILPPNNIIMKETVFKRLTAERREACDFTFSDFEDARFKVSTPIENKNILLIEVHFPYWKQIASHGAIEGAKIHFNKYLQDESFTNGWVKLKVNMDDFSDRKAAEKFSEEVSNIKNHVVCEVLKKFFRAMLKGAPLPGTVRVDLRSDTVMLVRSAEDRVNVSFGFSFSDRTNRLIGNTILHELVETRRKVNSAPICAFTYGPPQNFPDAGVHKYSSWSFLTFGLFKNHVQTEQKMQKASETLFGFRSYLRFHINSSKSFFHQRMRLQVASMFKILSRARVEREKKEKTLSGKTFRRA